jgi:phosphatidylserine decarboxylase
MTCSKWQKHEGDGGKFVTLYRADPIQMGFWVPYRVWATVEFLLPLRDMIATKREAATLTRMCPEIVEFKRWIKAHSVYRMWVELMIDQANQFVETIDPDTKERIRYQDGNIVWIENFDSLFDMMNEIISTSPSFNATMMVGTPMNALLALSMATEAGSALFHDENFNLQLRKVLNAWNQYLKSRDSLDKLDIDNPEKEGSWISQAAWEAGVWDDMQHDRKKIGYGFNSWNDFFIRKFVNGARPFLGDPKTNINIGCETTPWQFEPCTNFETDFWVKEVNYSLVDLFAGQARWARLFDGGPVYQGFLSATYYHRWNAPIDGTLVRSWVQPGTYFAQRPGQGEVPGTWEGTESQAYLGHVATRAIFILKHQKCGYVALICIGMVEVSTCHIKPEFTVGEGDMPIHITRGTEIGHFEFGGSTHMMLFQKDKVDLEPWAIHALEHRGDKSPIPMGTVIAKSR